MLSLKVHNVLDYVVGAVLLVCPWLFGFADVEAGRYLFVWSGIGLIGYSLLTNYYYSVVRIIPLGVHMTLDALTGILLILGPTLFGYRDEISRGQYSLHVVLGLGAIGLVALTRPRTESAKTPSERAEISHDLPITH
jgi:hypothetical protein